MTTKTFTRVITCAKLDGLTPRDSLASRDFRIFDSPSSSTRGVSNYAVSLEGGFLMGSKLGILKVAAARCGMELHEYQQRVDAGEKWCIGCRDWHQRDAFGRDNSRADGLDAKCLTTRRQKYTPRERPRHGNYGPPRKPPRDGDKLQARSRVNLNVQLGKIPSPNDLPCADCGRVYNGEPPRHEYDHHLGYAAEHHEDVEAVCAPCHHVRSRERGEDQWGRRNG